MKKLIMILGCMALILVFSTYAMAGKGGVPGPNVVCTTIQDEVLTYSSGHYLYGKPIQTGYDLYGYNYNARIFDGYYANVYLGRDGFPPYDGDENTYLAENPVAATKWYWPYHNDKLKMKWNETWLDNKDCDGDNKLDRHYDYLSYIGSGASLTNHQSGMYVDGDEVCRWNYYVKIVAAPSDAYKSGDVWYAADDTEIGPVIWGSFAIIQENENDSCTGVHGRQYGSPAGPGFGKYGPE